MKYLAFFLLVSTTIFCQNDTIFIRKNVNPHSELHYKTDTIIFKSATLRHFLVGNSILSNTKNQQIAKSYGLFFDEFIVVDCEEEGRPEPTKYEAIQKTKDYWVIMINVPENCCHSFLSDIKVDNENTLNLLYQTYGNYCSCNCSYELVYKIKIQDFPDLKKIKFLSINGKHKIKL